MFCRYKDLIKGMVYGDSLSESNKIERILKSPEILREFLDQWKQPTHSTQGRKLGSSSASGSLSYNENKGEFFTVDRGIEIIISLITRYNEGLKEELGKLGTLDERSIRKFIYDSLKKVRGDQQRVKQDKDFSPGFKEALSQLVEKIPEEIDGFGDYEKKTEEVVEWINKGNKDELAEEDFIINEKHPASIIDEGITWKRKWKGDAIELKIENISGLYEAIKNLQRKEQIIRGDGVRL